MFDCFAAAGYTGRVEEINFGSRTVLGADTGAGTRAQECRGGGDGGLDVRPAEVSNPAGGVPPVGSAAAISVTGVAPSPGSA